MEVGVLVWMLWKEYCEETDKIVMVTSTSVPLHQENLADPIVFEEPIGVWMRMKRTSLLAHGL